jgi:hypothetical protein
MVDAALLRRGGELKGDLVVFSQQPRFDRALIARFVAVGDEWILSGPSQVSPLSERLAEFAEQR